MRYAIAFGSNVGDRLSNLRKARTALQVFHAAEESHEEPRFSSVYETQPVDCEKASNSFYNAVGLFDFKREPADVLALLQRLETMQFGRPPADERSINAPRTLDLDILFAGNLEIDRPNLTLPHPRWHLRRFVLEPLAELCADTVVAGQSRTVGEILTALTDSEETPPRRLCGADDWRPTQRPMTAENLANWRNRETASCTAPLLSLTAYDYPTARILDEAGVHLVLVGDSLGMVFAGLPDTTGVTIDHMVYHTEVVRRGVKRALLVADLPYQSYQDIESTLTNARRLVDAGADLVKLEGGSGQKHKIEALSDAGIATVGHLGMLPQRVLEEGGYKKKGKSDADIEQLLTGARDLEQAGVSAIVLESIVADVADAITSEVSVPTIGIGSGNGCDGQIRVINDLLGSYPWFVPPFATPYADFSGDLKRAVERFRDEIGSQWTPAARQV